LQDLDNANIFHEKGISIIDSKFIKKGLASISSCYKPYGLFFGVTCAPSTIGCIMFWLLAQCSYTLPSK